MIYEIVRDGTYFRVTLNGEYDDSDPLYQSRSLAQKAIDRTRAKETFYVESEDRAFTFVQGYFV